MTAQDVTPDDTDLDGHQWTEDDGYLIHDPYMCQMCRDDDSQQETGS